MVGIAFSAAADDAADVVQNRRQFVPDTVTIEHGDTVAIRNDDPFFHHLYVESDRFQFSSAEQKPHEVVAIKFPTPGEYDVQCRIHLKMKLHVVVQ
jgi:plastocyanin